MNKPSPDHAWRRWQGDPAKAKPPIPKEKNGCDGPGGMPCGDALTNPKRVSRAGFVCPRCDRDISLHVLFLEQAKEREKELEK